MVIIVLTIVLAFVSTGVQSSCSIEDAEACLAPMVDAKKQLTKSTSSFAFSSYQPNDEQLNNYCRAGRQMESCYNQLQNCEISVANIIEDQLKLVKFLCIDTLEEYQSYRRCYAERAVINGMQLCNQNISKIITSLHLSTNDDLQKLCRVVNDAYSCTRNVVQPKCGKKAADWEINFLKIFLAPVLRHVTCPEEEHLCPETSVAECLNPVTDFRQTLGFIGHYYLNYYPIHLLSNDELYNYCRAFQKMNSCYNRPRNCTFSSSFRDEHIPMEFLCTDTLEEYKTYKRCYDEAPSVISGLQQCSNKIYHNFPRIDWDNLDVGNNMNTICRNVSETYSCVRGAVESECGTKAADWEITYIKKSISYINDGFLECKDESRKDIAFPIWAMCVTVVGVIIFMVCATVIGLIKIIRKKKTADGSAIQFNNVLATEKL